MIKHQRTQDNSNNFSSSRYQRKHMLFEISYYVVYAYLTQYLQNYQKDYIYYTRRIVEDELERWYE